MAAQAPPQNEVRESVHLDCIHCGICLSACPTYLQIGNEADSPRGRIYLIQAMKDRRLPADSLSFQRHMQLCLECRACETACPSGVRFSSMMDEARIEIRRHRKQSAAGEFARRFLLQRVVPSRRLLHAGFILLKCYQRSGLRRLVRASGLLRLMPGIIARMEALLPDIPPRPGYALPSTLTAVTGPRALIFEGCIMPELFGPVQAATVRVLRRNGVAVALPEHQTCCGALHLHDGDADDARRLARRNIEAFERSGDGVIVVNAAGCGVMLKEYDRLLADDAGWAERARSFSRRVRDISEFLDEIGIDPEMGRVDLRVAYNDPCHLLHGQGIREAPRKLLRLIPGLRLVELREADRCCGSAGIYNLTQPDMAERLLNEKVADVIRSGAQAVASGNPGCLLQLRAGLEARNLPIQTLHPVELLDQAYTHRSLRPKGSRT